MEVNKKAGNLIFEQDYSSSTEALLTDLSTWFKKIYLVSKVLWFN